MDVEGKELEALRCFPFDAFHAPVWLIETLDANRRLLQENISLARGVRHASPGLASARLDPRLRVGVIQDNVFLRWQRPGGGAYDGLVPAMALGRISSRAPPGGPRLPAQLRAGPGTAPSRYCPPTPGTSSGGSCTGSARPSLASATALCVLSNTN